MTVPIIRWVRSVVQDGTFANESRGMLDFLFTIVAPIVECFAWMYFADERPAARRMTVGCAVIVLAVIGCFVSWVSWQRGFRLE